jgi:hypothetical protein
MSFLFGSQPSTSSTTASTTNSTQSGIQALLASLLTSGGVPAGESAASGGTFAAPLSSLQTSALGGLGTIAQGAAVPGNATTTANNALTALQQAFGYTAPQISAPSATPTLISSTPQAGAPSTVSAQQVGTLPAFIQGVVDPVTSNFLQTVAPALSGGAGRSAGGAYSSDTQLADALAESNLNTTLAGTGSQYALAGQEANQTANLQAAEANQTAGLSTNLANLQAALTTNAGNQSASNQVTLANLASLLSTGQTNVASTQAGEGDVLTALGLTPSTITAAEEPTADTTSILTQLLNAGSVPQATAQQQITGENTQYNTLLQLLAGFGTTPTQQTNTVAQQGSTGLLQGLLTGLAGNTGASNILAQALGYNPTATASDRRLKEGIVRVGELDNELPVYLFRYKGDPTPRIGLMADEVEQVSPRAVVTMPSGYKAVNYALAALEAL